MFICFRIDLDYVPWDTPDALEFGHGEPSTLLKLLELSNTSDAKFHFFASTRSILAFPTSIRVILQAEHQLDWLCKHPEEAQERFDKASNALLAENHILIGAAIKDSWPKEVMHLPKPIQFLSAKQGAKPEGVRLYTVNTLSDREAMRSGTSARVWTDDIKMRVRDAASRRLGIIVNIRPQVLARFDPKLNHIEELIAFAEAVSLPVKTLREVDSESKSAVS